MGVSLVIESWTWYAIAVLLIIFRFVSRIVQLGTWRRLMAEDYVMIAVFCIYTVLVSAMNIVVHSDTNLLQPGDLETLTPESIKSRIYGSKMVLLVEQSMILTVWGCKCCLLLMYGKLTFGLKQMYAVKFVAGYIGVTFVVMEICYFGVWCRPFKQYWAVPTNNIQCSAAIHHLIMNAVFNVTSDIMMLCIPLPLLIASKLPKNNKIVLCGLFSLGIFVIVSAVINKYYSFTQPFSPIWTFWYIREASTAIFVANIPNCWSLVRRMFKLRSFYGSSNKGTYPYGNGTTRASGIGLSAMGTRTGNRTFTRRASVSMNGRERIADDADSEENAVFGKNTTMSKDWEKNHQLGKSESQEEINKSAPMEIWQSTNVTFDEQKGGDDTLTEQLKMYNGIGGDLKGSDFKTRTVITTTTPTTP